MNRNFPLQLIILFTLLSFPIISHAYDYVPKDFEMDVDTKGFDGAKANVSARLDAPLLAVWSAVLDTNNHGGKYPRMKRSFCMSEEDVRESKKKGLRNGATVERKYKKKMCEPSKMRREGEIWTYYIFQEFDYPFPLTDRWVMAEGVNDETELNEGRVSQTGRLIYGRQDIFEFKLALSSHPKYPEQTRLDLYIWSDPGGIIAGWMVKEATKYVAPRFMEILEHEGRKWVGGYPTDEEEAAASTKREKHPKPKGAPSRANRQKGN
jgi:hypothetical protein